MAKYEKISDNRPVRDGDFVLIDFDGSKDGAAVPEFAKVENFSMQIGKAAISDDFDHQLIGMRAGDSKAFETQFDKDHPNEKLAGQQISFQVMLSEIRQEILPPIDDELAKKAGPYETLDDLKKIIMENLRQGYEKRTEQELNEQIFSELIAKTEFEVPNALVEMELEGIIEEAERSFAYRNISLEEMGLSREAIAEKYRDTALKQVKRHLILDKIIHQESLSLTDEELEDGLKSMAENFNQPLEEIKKYYAQNQDKLEFFKHTLLEKKAIKLIIDSGIIKDVKPETLPKAESEKQTKKTKK
jgi:trigger factor